MGIKFAMDVLLTNVLEPDLLQVYDMEAKGIPIGKPAEVSLRNNHAQYIFTWYALFPVLHVFGLD